MPRSRTLLLLLSFSLFFLVVLLVVPFDVLAQATPAAPPPPAAAPSIAEQDSLMMRVLWWIVSSVFGGLTWATGKLLDYSITELVVNFGQLFQSSGLGVAVNNLWGVVRDIFNLTFIFGLIYIGFRMIINSDDSGAKKAIVNLIIAALLVNFSLFITKTVIDFSNIAAVQITQVIYQGGTTNNQSISVAFGVQMGLSSLWGMTPAQTSQVRITTGAALPQGGLLYIFGAMILFLIAAFSFAAGAILLFVRFIALNIMMILSPIMFLGRVFEPLQSYSSAYWKKFLNYCFFAPAFLLMLYFSLYILGTFTGVMRQTSGLAAELGPGGNSVNAIAGLLMSGGFLIASVLVAQKLSIAGSAMTLKVGNNMRNKMQGGIQGAIGRRTVGWGSDKLEKLNDRLQTTRGGRFSKGLLSVSTLGALDEQARKGLIKAGKEAKFGSSNSYQSNKDFAKKLKAQTGDLEEVAKIKRTLGAFSTANARGGASNDLRIEMERAVAGASGVQLKQILDSASTDTYKTVTNSMSVSQYDSLMKEKDEEFSQANKDKLSAERREGILNTIDTKHAGDISKATNDQLKVIGSKELSARARNLSFSQIDEIKKNNNFSDTEREQIITAHKEGLSARAAEDPTAFFSKIKPADFAKIPESVLTEQAEYLTFEQMDAINKNNDINDAAKANVVAAHKTGLVEAFRSVGPAVFMRSIKENDVGKLPGTILTNPAVAEYIRTSSLREMIPRLSPTERAAIRSNLETIYPDAASDRYKVRKWLDSSAGSVF